VARTGETLRLVVSLEPPANHALEAGPLLLQAGVNVFDPNAEPFRDRAPVEAVAAQSAVAWSQEGALFFIVTEPMRPEALARVLQEQGLWGAIRMDGGGSAQLWVQGRLRNPGNGLLGARPVVSGLALYPRP
jgi:exopolysaccharide biosynthesis protein